jgi:hypothetical protein
VVSELKNRINGDALKNVRRGTSMTFMEERSNSLETDRNYVCYKLVATCSVLISNWLDKG